MLMRHISSRNYFIAHFGYQAAKCLHFFSREEIDKMADCDPESAGNQEENAEIIPGYKDINAVVQVD